MPIKNKKERLTALAVSAGLFLLLLSGRMIPPFEFGTVKKNSGFIIRDRQGGILRAVGREQGLWADGDEISPRLAQATLFSEDRRYLIHHGVDPLALAGAVLRNAAAGRAAYGGSTITMQTARLLLGPRPRDIKAKFEEILMSGYLEWRLTKKQILELYLNLAPYANRQIGCRAASLWYFGVEPGQLTPAQATWLAVIPRNPNLYDPKRGAERLERARRILIEGMKRAGLLQAEEAAEAYNPPTVSAQTPPFAAPHFCDWVLSKNSGEGGDLKTTIDQKLTGELEKHLRAYVKKLSRYGISNAAAVVIRNSDMALLAMVGSADYFDSRISGQVNGAVARHQPGSALKPFTYGLALERGFPASYLLPDIDFDPSPDEERFIPRNYDERYHGPVRLRTALGCSYNVAAVRMLEQVGQPELLNRLRKAGFQSLRHDPDHYGLGLTLGNGEVTLLEMARAYAALANMGLYRDVKYLTKEGDGNLSSPALRTSGHERKSQDGHGPDSVRIFSRQVAYILAHMLSDRSARQPAFGECSPLDLPFPCAAKTGTTKDYRDNWTVGFTTDYTVGVWVGNFDGRPMHGVSGVSGAGPLFRDIMLALHRERRPEAFARPEGIEERGICPLSGDLAGPGCPNLMSEVFLSGMSPKAQCRFHDRWGNRVYPPVFRDWASKSEGDESAKIGAGNACYIAFPKDGEVFRIDPGLRRESQEITFKAVVPGAAREVEWTLDGRRLSGEIAPKWRLEPGEHVLSIKVVMDGRERRHRLRFTVLI
jgi:penicillin-binding protein 1C